MLDTQGNFPAIRLIQKNEKATSRNNAVLKYNVVPASMKDRDVAIPQLMQTLEQFESGKLVPYLRSEAAPEEDEEDPYDPVKVIVGSTFAKFVNRHRRKKDVFVNFFAPWCGHCKRLQPVWKDLALKMKLNDHKVVIAKIDSTANEIPGISIRGYPTMLLFTALSRLPDDVKNPADIPDKDGNLPQPEEIAKQRKLEEEEDEKKNPVDVANVSLMGVKEYDGMRSAEGMIQFLQNEAVNKPFDMERKRFRSRKEDAGDGATPVPEADHDGYHPPEGDSHDHEDYPGKPKTPKEVPQGHSDDL